MKTLYFLLTLALGISTSFANPAPANLPRDTNESDLGTAITVIFDNSGSMQGQKITEAKTAFQVWLSKAPSGYTWSLIDFDEGGKLVVPFGKDQAKVSDAISGFTAHTNTPIVNALKIAAKQIVERRTQVNPYERHLVLLFTDGQENQDPGGDDAVLKAIGKMRALNIEVVGIGYHGDGDYLAKSATHYYQADDVEALKTGLNKVDAEVDLGGEIQVTPDDLKAISQLPLPAKHAEEESPDTGQETAATDAPAPAAAPSKFDLPIPLLVGGFVIFVLVVQAFSRKR